MQTEAASAETTSESATGTDGGFFRQTLGACCHQKHLLQPGGTLIRPEIVDLRLGVSTS